MLVNIVQYPMRNRYQQWLGDESHKQFSKYFDVVTIKGNYEEANKEKVYFSSVFHAIRWEAEQLKKITELLSKNPDFFVWDVSFVGMFVTLIPEIKMLSPESKIYSFCHATSVNRYDYYTPVRVFKKALERVMLKASDIVFTSTEYHRNKLIKHFGKAVEGKIHVCYGLPIPPLINQLNLNEHRDNIVTIPSRICRQKFSYKFLRTLRSRLRRYNIEVVLSIDVTNSLEEYYKLLCRSRAVIMKTKEDTFGYPILEASLLGVPVFCNSHESYIETVRRRYIYTSMDDLVNKVLKVDPTSKVVSLKNAYREGSINFWKTLCEKIKTNKLGSTKDANH